MGGPEAQAMPPWNQVGRKLWPEQDERWGQVPIALVVRLSWGGQGRSNQSQSEPTGLRFELPQTPVLPDFAAPGPQSKGLAVGLVTGLVPGLEPAP